MDKTPAPVTVATLARQLSGSGSDVQLLPDGDFTAVDGRPVGLPGVTAKAWRMDAAAAQAIITTRNARKNRVTIDYEHQTQLAATNGQPAPAAGSYSRLEWRPGSGLWATDVKWTARAAAHIAAEEYIYISPVFSFDPATGAVQDLYMAAITNNPGIDGMAVVALTQYYQTNPEPTQEAPDMDKLLAALLAALNLPQGTTPDQASAALTAHLVEVATLKNATANQAAQIATLAAQAASAAPDPTKFVPIAALTDMQAQLRQLTEFNQTNTVAQLVQQGLAQGKLTAATQQWATDMGKKDVAMLQSFLAAQPANLALAGSQTNGTPPAGATSQTAALTAEDRQVAALMGLDPAKLLPLPAAAASGVAA